MYEANVRSLLEEVRAGRLPVEAMERLRFLPYEELGFAKIDHHRVIRKGFPEVVFCLGKTPSQVQSISLAPGGGQSHRPGHLADEKAYQAVGRSSGGQVLPRGEIILMGEGAKASVPRRIAVLTAGPRMCPSPKRPR